MITVITPQQFKQVPWKNGQGQTTELAINPGGDVNDFEWRISIADMVKSGEFSSFAGFERHLVLLKGSNLTLNHQHHQDILAKPLDIAIFDGGEPTEGILGSGPVNNFNVMAQAATYITKVICCATQQTIKIETCDHCFVYQLQSQPQQSVLPSNPLLSLEPGHLLHITKESSDEIIIQGQNIIVITFKNIETPGSDLES